MHRLSSAFVLGYHGCDARIAKTVVAGKHFQPSNNSYDWLGPGIYFWEANPVRGLEYATELMKSGRGKSKITKPTVVGAVIDLGHCLDLTSAAAVKLVRQAHKRLEAIAEKANQKLPGNSPDLMRRNLDCAVIRVLHEVTPDTPFDTVRGIFVEGQPIFEGSGFYDKTHVQICVCNPKAIRGVFKVPEEHLI